MLDLDSQISNYESLGMAEVKYGVDKKGQDFRVLCFQLTQQLLLQIIRSRNDISVEPQWDRMWADSTVYKKLMEFCAATNDLPAQNRFLRRTISDWSADSTGQAAKRLLALVELVREKSQIEGQGKNSIRREDVLDALECDEDQLFPADTRFVDVGDVVERGALQDVKDEIKACNLPVFLRADGGVGKTVFIRSLAAHLTDIFEVVVFDCFGGGAYRSRPRHVTCQKSACYKSLMNWRRADSAIHSFQPTATSMA